MHTSIVSGHVTGIGPKPAKSAPFWPKRSGKFNPSEHDTGCVDVGEPLDAPGHAVQNNLVRMIARSKAQLFQIVKSMGVTDVVMSVPDQLHTYILDHKTFLVEDPEHPKCFRINNSEEILNEEIFVVLEKARRLTHVFRSETLTFEVMREDGEGVHHLLRVTIKKM